MGHEARLCRQAGPDQILALPFCDFRENYFSKPPFVIFKVEGTAATAMVISGAGKAASQA